MFWVIVYKDLMSTSGFGPLENANMVMCQKVYQHTESLNINCDQMLGDFKGHQISLLILESKRSTACSLYPLRWPKLSSAQSPRGLTRNLR